MANKKITELTAADTPIGYDELMEIVQAGENKKLAISEILADVNSIQFNTAPTPGSHSEGLIYWDAAAGTLAVMTDVDDVVLQVGQETYVKARNNTGAVINNGEAVYITGSIGSLPTVAKAQADSLTTIQVLGLATEDIGNNEAGYITVRGVVRDVNTGSFLDGDPLFLSEATAGGLSDTVPATGYSVKIGSVIYAHNTSGMILVNPIVLGIIGDLANGNYLEVFSDGSVLLHGEATAWDDLRVPLNATNLGGSKDPDFSVFKNNGAASQGVFIYWFSATQEEELYFAVQLPHAWLEGSDIDAHIHWVPSANGAVGQVVSWGLEYTWQNIGAVFGNTAIISANDTEQGDGSLVASKHYLTELGSIDATGKTFSSMLICRVFRDATGSLNTDDYPSDAGLLEVDFHYQIDKLGSRSEYS